MATATRAKPATNGHVDLSVRPMSDKFGFPFTFGVLSLEGMFVDDAYQRPLTNFLAEVRDNFDAALVGCLVVNNRTWDQRRQAKPYAIVDGQTRWTAMSELDMPGAPCTIFMGLTIKQEASLFARLQMLRRGMVSYTRFRAQLTAEEPEALKIKVLVEDCGYTLGASGKGGEIRSVAALEKCFRRDATVLERTLDTFKAAWKTATPSGTIIRGLFRFFEDNPEVDDEKLVRRLSITTEAELLKRAMMLKEGSGHVSTSTDRFLSTVIKNLYTKRMT